MLCIWFAIAIQLAHLVSIPVFFTFDSRWYVKLASLIGTARFTAEWDYLRTPLYPALLKICFWFFGEQPISVCVLNCIFAACGIWLVSRTVARLGRSFEASILLIVLSAFPMLVTYEHVALTETGTFFFLAAIGYILTLRPTGLRCPLLLTAVITAGFYHRSSLLYMAPAAAVLFGAVSFFEIARGSGAISPQLVMRRIAAPAIVVAVVPFVAAWPWQRNPAVSLRTGQSVLMYGLVRQAVIPPEDPFWSSYAPVYRAALERSIVNGRLPADGLQNGTEYGLMPFAYAYGQRAPSTFLRAVQRYPARYLAGVYRNLLLFAGLGGSSDSAGYESLVLIAPEPQTVIARDPGPLPLPEFFDQKVKGSFVRTAFKLAIPIYSVLVTVAFLASILSLAAGLIRLDVPLVCLSALPLVFIFLHALILTSQDRMSFPAYPLLIASLTFTAGTLIRRARSRQLSAG